MNVVSLGDEGVVTTHIVSSRLPGPTVSIATNRAVKLLDGFAVPPLTSTAIFTLHSLATTMERRPILQAASLNNRESGVSHLGEL